MSNKLVRAWRAMTASPTLKAIDRTDVVITLGLVLISAGLWEVSRPAALVVPGVVLVWLALPPRPPFIGGK